jgi:hypothetical protein
VHQRSDHCHMSSSLRTISSSESTFVPPCFLALFLSSLVTNRPGVIGVIGVKGWYALYGVCGTPVLGAGCSMLSRFSRYVIFVAGALCGGVYASRNGRLLVLFAADDRRGRGAGAWALVPCFLSSSRACVAADFTSISRACAAADFIAGVSGGGPGL